MENRKYQSDALDAIKDSYRKGVRKQLISMATGTGKTIIFSQLPQVLKDVLPGQMLVLAHREELIDQAIDKIKRLNPTLKISKEKAEHRADSEADVIVASVATLGRKNTKRTEKFDWNRIDKIVIDEAHHAIANSYCNILNTSGVLLPSSSCLVLGCTATPQRGDGRALAEIFEKITYSYGIRPAIEDGWLVDVKGFRVNTNINLDNVRVSKGDFEQGELEDTVNNPERNSRVVKSWLDKGGNRQTIVFTVGIQHAQDLAKEFQRHGVAAEAIWGNDPERALKLEAHKQGKITVLTNCGVLTEGYDDWRVGCILLAKPTKSGMLFTQMVGRGTRLQEGTGNLKDVPDQSNVKRDLIVIDVVDVSSRHSLVTLPTLLGMSGALDLKGMSMVGAVKKLEEAQKEHPTIDLSRITDITQLESYIEKFDPFEIKYPDEVENSSELCWHNAIDGGFILLLPEKEQIKITPNLLDKWELSGIIKGNKYKGIRDTIEEAFKAADELIYNKAAQHLKILRRKEKWHADPCTLQQLMFLRRLYPARTFPGTLTKGQASMLITQGKVKKVK